MSSETVIAIENISKSYSIYNTPVDRLKQFILPRISKFLGKEAKRYYKDFWALKELSLEIKKGDVVGVIGRNGSGKSTLLQIVCGTLNPTQGTLIINGRIAALLELGSGFNPEFTGKENIYMNASVLGLSKNEIKARYDDIVKFADIGDFINRPVKTYSSGMNMRLAFSVIAHVSADILVIDEALSVGDAFFTQKCIRFLRKFMETGTILFVSHDIGAILNLCNKAILMSGGSISHIGSPREIADIYFAQEHASNRTLSDVEQSETIQLIDNSARVANDQIKLSDKNSSKEINKAVPFEFNIDAAQTGNGAAKIISVGLYDINEQSFSLLSGGEKVKLKISCAIYEDLDRPIVGFEFRDRLGQVVFGDNSFLTYLESQFLCNSGKLIDATFIFRMPLMAQGDYSITAAIANGTQHNHTIIHWVYDALIIKVASSSHRFGIITVPMIEISLKQI